uniref:Acyl-CoA-binding domain-containing protein 6 n=1 Tax=Ciona savignyi TaxID=51511 RepID=H2Z4R6_CIOSA
ILIMSSNSELEEQFSAAANHLQIIIKSNSGKPKECELLYLYGRYKLCTEGPCCTPKPGILNFSSRKKWNAWNSLSKLSRTEAMTEYIEKIKQLDPEWTLEVEKQKHGLGISVSTLNHSSEDGDDKQVLDCNKDLFDWCKEGSLINIKNMKPEKWPFDNEKRSLLHWSCDRGHQHIVDYLIQEGHDLNGQDVDGLTALHYASSCDRGDIVELLLKHGADPAICDADGESAWECCSSPSVKNLFNIYCKSLLT